MVNPHKHESRWGHQLARAALSSQQKDKKKQKREQLERVVRGVPNHEPRLAALFRNLRLRQIASQNVYNRNREGIHPHNPNHEQLNYMNEKRGSQ